MNKSQSLRGFAQKISCENLYTLAIKHRQNKVLILMRLLIPQVNMRDFPMTQTILSLYLPSIYQSTCYNDEHLSFDQEVPQTEIGHLFEHILLEYLCIIKLEQGKNCASYEGVTDWNWTRDPMGTFHITIHAERSDIAIFREALTRTMILINIILTKDETLLARLPLPTQSVNYSENPAILA